METPDTSSAAAAQSADARADDRHYFGFLQGVQDTFAASLDPDGSRPLFRTDAQDLFESYLEYLPDQRQVHNCHACKWFFDHCGGLAVIDNDGRLQSAVWHEDRVPVFYSGVTRVLRGAVARAAVTGVFLSKDAVLGRPTTPARDGKVWTHLSLVLSARAVYKMLTRTPGQSAAAKLENYRDVCRALGEYHPDLIDRAVAVLETETLYRSEAVIGPARFLRDLHVARARLRGEAKDNVTWLAVAKAPEGFCHPRASMVGTLLEDLKNGLPIEDAARKFAEKMHPLQYQRPQAAPTAGNIARAEVLFGQLGLAPALERRFARLEEVEALWRPTSQPEPAAGKVFAHLQPKGTPAADPRQVTAAPVTITWDKFRRTVLPAATAIKMYVPSHGAFAALATAVHPDAPPLLQWDSPERRNPVSWYVYPGGSPAGMWGLVHGSYCDVTAVTLAPYRWYGATEGSSHHGDRAFLLLKGAADSRISGLGLFPECLRSELHEVRATVEAHSRSGGLSGRTEATACGLMLSKGQNWDVKVRVTSGAAVADYVLDRWD